jgi:hypothetical protein
VVGNLLVNVSEGGVGHFYRGAIFYCDRKAVVLFVCKRREGDFVLIRYCASMKNAITSPHFLHGYF